MKDPGIGVATESQRGEVTPPRPHSWSVAKLDIMWRQYPPVLVLPLLAIAKGREFSSESVFCYNPKSHTSTQGGLTVQDFSWAVAHLGQCWAFVQAVPPPGTSFLLALQLFNPPQPTTLFRICLLLSGGHSSMLPQKRDHIFQLVGRCIQATFSLLSHTDKGFRKCQLSWLWFTFFNTLFFFHV